MAHTLYLNDGDKEALRLASLLHDIGIVTIPEDILNKPGALTPGRMAGSKTASHHGR